MSVTVSVIMPVCRTARALPSLLATRVPDGVTVDLVVVDDTGELGPVPADAPFPVRVLRHDTPRGLAAARNTGLAAATGEYVWFVGGDDWVDPELLASLTSAVLAALGDEDRADIVVAGTVPVTEDGVTGPPLPSRDTATVWTGQQAVEEFLFRRIRSGVTNKLVRRDLLDGLVFPHGPRHEDVAVMAWLLLRARTVAFVAGPAYFHLSRPVSRFNPRTAERAAAVDEALFVLDGAGSPAARQHFRLRAGALAVAGAAARSSAGELSAAAWDAVGAARRGLRPRDAWAALRHRQVVLAAAVLLIRAAPALYVRLYRAARAADRHRHARLGRPWRGEAAALQSAAGVTPAVAGVTPAVAGVTPAVAGTTPAVAGTTPAAAGPTPAVPSQPGPADQAAPCAAVSKPVHDDIADQNAASAETVDDADVRAVGDAGAGMAVDADVRPVGDADVRAAGDAGVGAAADVRPVGDAEARMAGDAEVRVAADAGVGMAVDADDRAVGDAEVRAGGDADVRVVGGADVPAVGDVDIRTGGDADDRAVGDVDVCRAAVPAQGTDAAAARAVPADGPTPAAGATHDSAERV
ncbi:glycosyltransferase [Dactylosporangium sp. NPDC050588]|uniref:glycosyltransferase n=1 Tax=Dactylosporangium sp. NPDC050588 TaxID=3157211 RepID=UPI0033D5025A